MRKQNKKMSRYDMAMISKTQLPKKDETPKEKY